MATHFSGVDERSHFMAGVFTIDQETPPKSPQAFCNHCQYWHLTDWMGMRQGAALPFDDILSKNVPLLTLLVGISYLRWVMPNGNLDRHQGGGAMRLLQSTMIAHLFASVINLSAIFIVIDGSHGCDAARKHYIIPIARAYGAAAFWSPFFVAMGVALTYAPEAKVHHLMILGIPTALLTLLITVLEHRLRHKEGNISILDYPVTLSTLMVPVTLIAGVLIVHILASGYPIILIVAGLCVTISVLDGFRDHHHSFVRHTHTFAPMMGGELALFLSAGIMAAGIQVVVGSTDISFLGTITGISFYVTLFLMMLIAAMIGVHPVISISTVGTILGTHGNNDLLGAVFLLVWGLGIIGGPLSGLNLSLQTRYGLEPLKLFKDQLPFIIVMMLLSPMILKLYSLILDFMNS